MSSILLVTSSPRGSESLSNAIATDLAEKFAAQNGGALVRRDLVETQLDHVDGAFTAAIRKAPDARTAEEAEAVALSDALVAELMAADTIVIGTGLINFNIYSSLKSWIDHIARAGLTFSYTENGPVGLAKGKKAYLVLAAGGIYSTGPGAPMNHAEPISRRFSVFSASSWWKRFMSKALPTVRKRPKRLSHRPRPRSRNWLAPPDPPPAQSTS